ncbi:hypothetical protein TVAG_465240 [Trichomonas vaginalis G3]|uniref:Uncharacterized protein n=1 Tax=Trichomonas vaginalis (strain ATCC PRA-98 / G3) TaxID=412133 RepID=A2DTY9_TRIV3|nr:spectrin binding [Trichomonas vaginalis G3]EAY16136.1 hypothetical protein TVAG_465240 [Trichomonas vaginalis G3]KAI5510447.1 spectrin binding [Trichomonas vaginalis G3]|eukprot:XP_001328359.1 hypothetical protein [Trichomonas vaginalis G3]
MDKEYADSSHPLALAIEKNSIEDVKHLVESGADVNMIIHDKIITEVYNSEPDGFNYIEKKKTPLTLSVKKNAIEIAKYLIERGANVNAEATRHKTIYGTTDVTSKSPLTLAFKQNSIELIRYLIEHGADFKKVIPAKDYYEERAPKCWKKKKVISGKYPLTIAIEHDMADIAKYLVEHDADVNVQTRKGFTYKTPLKVAIKKGWIEMIQYLIDNDADVNMEICDFPGGYDYKAMKTPLSIAIRHNSLEIVKILVENGADVNAEIIKNDPETFNDIEFYPLDTARADIKDYLAKHGAIS